MQHQVVCCAAGPFREAQAHRGDAAGDACAAEGELSAQKFDFLLRGPQRVGVTNPVVEWLPDSVWASVQALKVRPASQRVRRISLPLLWVACVNS